MASAQDVRLSDIEPWMARRNDSNFLKRAGSGNDWGVFSFGYFSLDKQRKVTRQQAKQKLIKKSKI